ncbi:MAG: hypothetical protein K9G46_00895 [Flavobacteriales bacterium]|nr:hypothetical protein [Flavobacteriales bacterium]
MTVIIRASDSAEQLERKMARAMEAHRKQASTKLFDPFKFLGKLKNVYGDGLEYQRKLRDEW